VDSVRWRFEDDPRLSGIAERLAQDGLLRPKIMPFPGRQRRLGCRTRAGRQLLRRLRTEPPADAVAGSTSALLVALDGPERMSNPRRRAEVFTAPFLLSQSAEPRTGGRPRTSWSRDGLLGHGVGDTTFWYRQH